MTTRFTHIPLSLLVVALTLFSCISDREVCADSSTSDDKVQVKFTIAMDNASASTRGTWDNDIKENGEGGSYYENTIEQGKLQVLVYKTDNNTDTYIGKVEDASYIRRSDTENNIYDVLGTLPIEKDDLGKGYTMNAKIVVLANYDSEASPTKGDNITAVTNTFSYKHDEMAATTPTAYIPMWGIKYVQLNLTPGTNTDIGDIHMLRAMTKVKVSIDSNTGYTLQGVTLTDHNPNGNLVPNISTGSNENFLTSLTTGKGTETLDADASFNPATRIGDDANVKTAAFWTDSNGDYIIYVPEYEQGNTPASLTVELSNDEGKTKASYSMALQTYDSNGNADGNNLNLVRNTIYSYTITKVGSEELYVQFAREPWDQVTSQIGWDAQNGVGADFVFYAWPSTDDKTNVIKNISTVQGDGTKGDSEAPVCILNYPRYENTAHTTLKFKGTAGTYYDGEASAASYYFKLTKPVGAVWQAYLVNDNWKELNKDANGNLIAENDSNFQISLGSDEWLNESGGKSHVSVSTGIAREEPYLIKIAPRHSWYQISSEKDFNDDNSTTHLTDYGAAWQRYAESHDLDLAAADKPAKCWIRYYMNTDNTAAYVGGPHVDLRIRITLDGTHWYDLAINPKDQKVPEEDTDLNTYYSDGRRFAVGDESSDDFHLRIWQVKTRTKKYDKSGISVSSDNEKGLGYDRLSDDNPENITMKDQWGDKYPYSTTKYYTTE